MFKKLLAAALVCLASAAHAQTGVQFPAGTVWGNETASARPGKVSTMPAMLDRAFGSTSGMIIYRGVSLWSALAPNASGTAFLSENASGVPSWLVMGTGVTTALAVNIGTAGSFVVNGGALGSPSSAGTLPAHTLGGTIAGGGNQINNVIIGTTTPLAGTFTTLNSGIHTVTSASNAAFAVGASGSTNSSFTIDASTASQAAGLKVTGAVTTGRVNISVTDPAADASLGINGKGAGDIAIANQSTGGISLNRATTFATITGSTQCMHVNSSGVATGTGLDCGVASTPLTASLLADVPMNNTANYFDGPSIAQGTVGTWFASGTVTMSDTAGAFGPICVLTDATSAGSITGTKMASSRTSVTVAGNLATLSLSGMITSPVGNIRIACRDSSSTNGTILFNTTGNGKDSTISAFRLQ